MTVTRRITSDRLRGCHCRAAKQRGYDECCRYFVLVCSYHFVIAMWRGKGAESEHDGNDTSPTKTFDEPHALPARSVSHSARPRLFCAFAASASGLSRRLLNEPKHSPR